MSGAVPLTKEQHIEIMKTMNTNTMFFKRNPQVIAILTTEATIGCRLGDILRIKLSDIYMDDKGYRLRIKEQKTGKIRNVPMPAELYAYLTEYAMNNNRTKDMTIFSLTPRAVTKYIKKVSDYLGYRFTSHSWRKYYAMKIYNSSGKDLALTQRSLLHASIATTQIYIGVENEKLEEILRANNSIVNLEED